jgi:Ca-activated chloride channel homolog
MPTQAGRDEPRPGRQTARATSSGALSSASFGRAPEKGLKQTAPLRSRLCRLLKARGRISASFSNHSPAVRVRTQVIRGLVLLFTPLLAATAQTAAPDVRVDVNVVNVLCSVRDRRGAFVGDLGQGDFQILEDGRAQQIRYFAREVDTPFTVALLLDVSGSVTRVLEDERLAALRFFYEVLRPGDQGLLAAFSHIVEISQDLTSSADRLRTALRAVRPFELNLPTQYDAHGGTLLYEAIQTVCSRKLAALPGRKIVIVISDGVDNGSRIGAEGAIQSAQLADAVLYGIRYSGSDADSSEGERALERLSQATGGRNFHVGFPTTLASIFAAITEEMRSQYAIGYVSTNPARDGAYRGLTIKTTRAGMKIQARAGYYGPH